MGSWNRSCWYCNSGLSADWQAMYPLVYYQMFVRATKYHFFGWIFHKTTINIGAFSFFFVSVIFLEEVKSVNAYEDLIIGLDLITCTFKYLKFLSWIALLVVTYDVDYKYVMKRRLCCFFVLKSLVL